MLGAIKPAESSALEKLVAEALDAAAGRGLDSGAKVRISRRQGQPLSLVVTPFKTDAPDPFRGRRPAVVVFVSDPDKRIDMAEDMLERLHGLSPAEAKVAAEVLEGGTLSDVAERLGITRNTANTHLKRVFEKTGTRRQGELVRLLLLSAATMARR